MMLGVLLAGALVILYSSIGLWLVKILVCALIVGAYLYRRSIVGAEHTLQPRRRHAGLKLGYGEGWESANKAWEQDNIALNNEEDYLFERRPLFSNHLNRLLHWVVRDFVSSWFESIAQGPAFPNQVEMTIRYTLTRFKGIFLEKQLDITNLTFQKIVPMITSHLAEFSMAEEVVRRGDVSWRGLTESEEVDRVIASHYKDGNLHLGASLKHSELKSVQQEHLRKIVGQILPFVMPAEEVGSKTVFVLVREIVCCAVLQPLFELMSDADIFNQAIEALADSWLQDRRTVSKVRAAIRSQTEMSFPKSEGRSFNSRLQNYINDPTDHNYESVVNTVRRCSSLIDARRYRTELLIELSKTRERLTDGESTRLRNALNKLDILRRRLDDRIAKLSGSDELVGDNGGGSSGMETDTLTLSDLIADSTGLSYFMEYMDRMQRMPVLQFWLTVDGIKDPLEDSSIGEITPRDSFTFTESYDIVHLYETFLQPQLVNVGNQNLSSIVDFVTLLDKASPKQYIAARTAILKTQEEIFQVMNNEDFPAFRNTNLFHTYVSSYIVPPLRERTSTGMSNIQWKPTNTFDTLSMQDSIQGVQVNSENIADAVSTALNDIVHSADSDDARSIISRLSLDKSTASLKTPTDTTQLLEDLSVDMIDSSSDLLSRSKLFDDDEDNNSDSNSLNGLLNAGSTDFESGLSEVSYNSVEKDIQLDLIQEIDNLSKDIEQLDRESKVLDVLLRKANTKKDLSEKRILRKSQRSLQLERQRKELQRQVYLLQTSEGSLRERVKINSTSVGRDRKSDYVVYNITVEQIKSDNSVIGEWTVNRRYNDFFSLHKHLSHNFGLIKRLEFPKKKVVGKLQPSFVETRRLQLETYLKVRLASG